LVLENFRILEFVCAPNTVNNFFQVSINKMC